MSLGPHDGWMLRLFGAHVDQAFGHVPYHVGSSLGAKQPYRDVDVRLILPDDEYADLFGDPDEPGLDHKLRVWNLAWTALGHRMTGLPIDFQFQQQTYANREFGGPRGALVLLDVELPTAASGVER